MESLQDLKNRLRKERLAKQNARIEMLREINRNKYKNKDTVKNSVSLNASAATKTHNNMQKTKVSSKFEVAKTKNEGKAEKPVVQSGRSNISTNISEFRRLNITKTQPNTHGREVDKLNSDDPTILKIITNKRPTVFDVRPQNKTFVRRSLSANNLRAKKELLILSKSRSASISETLHNLIEINEDETPKIERKQGSFFTPIYSTNKEDLQSRLKSWLFKRGKSVDSYQHLQYFGLCQLPSKVNIDQKFENFDENTESLADSSDGSYSGNMKVTVKLNNNWRSASRVSDSVDLYGSQTTMTTSSELELVIGALNNLTELLKEGFEWSQGARWLRAIRERSPSTLQTAANWECRAVLEETRGDLSASVQCWEEAISRGIEHTVADASLDQLMDKFMMLNISPNAAKTPQQVNSKLVDVKNVFKSTIIRFAAQKAKL